MAAAVARPHGGEMGVEGERGGQEEERAGSGTAEPPTRVARPPREGEHRPTACRRSRWSRDHRGTGEHRLDRFRRMFYALLDNASGRFGRIRGRIVRHLAAPIGRFSPACLGVKAGPPASGIWGHSMRLDAARANKKLYSILRGWEAEEEQAGKQGKEREGVPIGSVGIPFQPAPNGRLQLGGARVTKT
ncbi:unnamed protein product, partial [Prorocentrum cordatum]